MLEKLKFEKLEFPLCVMTLLLAYLGCHLMIKLFLPVFIFREFLVTFLVFPTQG